MIFELLIPEAGSLNCEKRFVFVGTSGSGKSTLSRRTGEMMNLPVIELDSFFHLPNWQQRPYDEFDALVQEQIAIAEAESKGWIVDGNYNSPVGLKVQAQANVIVWLDLPRWRVMCQLIPRTLRRVLTREKLWNSNREPWTNLYSWDPEKNIIRYAWLKCPVMHERYLQRMESGGWDHARVVRIRSQRDKEQFLSELVL